MHQYSVRDVERLAHLPRARIRSLVEAGIVSPERGPGNAWRFSFQDLIVLRNAEALAAANVPRQRIRSSVQELRRRLPDSTPLSGLSLEADGNRVVVREGDRRWRAESGQYLLDFDTAPDAGRPVSPLERLVAAPPGSAEAWFERGAALERKDPEAALEAYAQAVSLDPRHLRARINLGCLLHETGRLDGAEEVYREALRESGEDPLLLYDLGVLLEDMDRRSEAMQAYEAALRADPRFADCHYNLALLCRGLGKPREAIRHMAEYRRLTAPTRST